MTYEDVTPLAPVRPQALAGTLILMSDTKSTTASTFRAILELYKKQRDPTNTDNCP